MKGKYLFEVVKTINETTAASHQKWKGKEVNAELVVKQCKLEKVSSQYSFYN